MPAASKVKPKSAPKKVGIRDDDGNLLKKAELPVWFSATCSHYPIESSTYEYFGQGASLKRVKHEGLELVFTPKLGTTRPFHPSKPADKAIIERVRKHIESDDPRVRQFNLREVRQDSGPPPFPKWDETKAAAIATLVKEGGWDIDRCVKYEQLNKARADVLAALVKLAEVDAPAEPKTLAADLS